MSLIVRYSGSDTLTKQCLSLFVTDLTYPCSAFNDYEENKSTSGQCIHHICGQFCNFPQTLDIH